MTLQPFTIAIPQAALDDLQARLDRTRWPDAADGADWTAGTSLDSLKALVDYWRHGYDWRAHEAAINAIPQFKVAINGVGIHFLHIKSRVPNATPIILTHGWPDSFYRFHSIVPLLVDPEQHGGTAADAFDVVIPSIPGFGFSDRRAMSSGAVADLWAALMTDVLGYPRFAAAGGDIGSGVTKALASRHPDKVTAIHLTDVGYPAEQGYDPPLSDAEQAFAGFIQGWWFMEGAYAMVHMTKPQSLAFALNDSPAGWAAWVLSFIKTGAGDTSVEAAFGGRDALLTNLMIYWVTETAGSAARMYLEEARASYGGYGDDGAPAQGGRSTPPAGIALFPREAQFPREWAERSVNVQRFATLPRGGHFAPLEEPDLFVSDLRDFFRQLRDEPSRPARERGVGTNE